MGILDKIAEIEREIARTQKNKGKFSSSRNVFVMVDTWLILD